MRRRLSVVMIVCLWISVASAAVALAGQDKGKKEEKGTAKLERVEGNIHMIDKATKTVTVTLRGKGNTQDVVYNDKTMFTFRNKPSTADEVKDGRHVICLGRWNAKKQLEAARIDVRDEK